ncbi:hypothetical protein CWI84_04850 [Idiomarina tyrosinivorans]|uniref:Uncharacterized protein n=1 Tax=Idiomarina tyrosinivorans TaxID=1445662 RepID=A0A432ZRE2_9GAMM|nr:hypothetical protein [Idiomarina tyrosinivorans]RUO80396.1 hypothetical protein CWI84_04850 [Idiomarina tyrosinivorans]
MSLSKALKNPADVYANPDAVLKDANLTDAEKIQVLEQWRLDAVEAEVADSENMAGGPPDQLPAILDALRKLGG